MCRAFFASLLFLAAVLVFLHACSPQGVQPCRLIYDFEEDQELDGLVWRCHSWYERSREHASHGSFSLKVQMYPPETYPGFAISDLKGPWKGISRVKLDIFNPNPFPLSITFRIDDKKDPPYEDRVNKTLELREGANPVTLDLADLKTSGTRRHLDPSSICAFMFFTVSPERPVTIFVDNIRLCK